MHISGATMDAYMGIPGMEADHVTLADPRRRAAPGGAAPALPEADASSSTARRATSPAPGFNHVCFRVEDLDATVAEFEAAGFPTRNQSMDFHDRKLVFLVGPANTVIELAQWHE